MPNRERKNLISNLAQGADAARAYRKGRVSDPDRGGQEIVIVKVGGSVLTGVKAFRRVALFLKHLVERKPNERLVVVVSAQKLMTDTLERRARRIVGAPAARALDLLWSTGELRSVALLALHLQGVGVSSVGLSVHETGLQFANEPQTYAAQPSVTGKFLEAALAEHAVVVVPGFLAIARNGAIVSLGRGGSDFSAVLLAIGLRAVRCELIKDVPGYFEDDPRGNVRARHLPSLSFEDALWMAEQGCELVQTSALLAAKDANLSLVIRSMSERAPVSVIAYRSQVGHGERRDERVGTQA
jgi:aspartate kinase